MIIGFLFSNLNFAVCNHNMNYEKDLTKAVLGDIESQHRTSIITLSRYMNLEVYNTKFHPIQTGLQWALSEAGVHNPEDQYYQYLPNNTNYKEVKAAFKQIKQAADLGHLPAINFFLNLRMNTKYLNFQKKYLLQQKQIVENVTANNPAKALLDLSFAKLCDKDIQQLLEFYINLYIGHYISSPTLSEMHYENERLKDMILRSLINEDSFMMEILNFFLIGVIPVGILVYTVFYLCDSEACKRNTQIGSFMTAAFLAIGRILEKGYKVHIVRKKKNEFRFESLNYARTAQFLSAYFITNNVLPQLNAEDIFSDRKSIIEQAKKNVDKSDQNKSCVERIILKRFVNS